MFAPVQLKLQHSSFKMWPETVGHVCVDLMIWNLADNII